MASPSLSSEETHIIICADIDYFYAQAEEIRNPKLKDVPVVVCMFSARGGDSGAVATCNYLARKYGVKSGMPIYQAKRLLKDIPEAQFISAKESFLYYEEKSSEVMDILKGSADRFEQVSIDEAYLDVTSKVNSNFDLAFQLGLAIKQTIRGSCGLTCSLGIAPNKLIAKMAADSKKPDGLTVIRPHQVTDFLWSLPVGNLYGVGTKTEQRLKQWGLVTIGDLAKTPLERLLSEFGHSLGNYLYNASRGLDTEPVQERGKIESISRIVTLRQNTRDFNLIWPTVEDLCGQVMERVQADRWMYRSVSLMFTMQNLTLQSRTHTMETPTSSPETLKKIAKELLTEYLKDRGKLQVRRVGVKVSGLVKGQEQVSLKEFF